MAPFWVDNGTAPWFTIASSPLWSSPTATNNTVTWPVNQTTGGTNCTTIPNWHTSQFAIAQALMDREWHDYQNDFVPYTPAIIRRLSDRHEREELAAAEVARREAAAERQRIEREARAMAGARSMELLLSHLTPEQRHTFEQNKWFVVEGGRTKRKYKIHANGGLNANIEVVGENHRLCAHCDHHIMPYNDHVLMQKVMLELDEDSFLRVANRHP